MKKIMQLMLLAAFISLPAWAGEAVAPVTATPKATPEATAVTPEATAKKAKTKKAKSKKGTAKKATPAATSAAVSQSICPPGCAMMNCPPPSGPIKCCNTTTHNAC